MDRLLSALLIEIDGLSSLVLLPPRVPSCTPHARSLPEYLQVSKYLSLCVQMTRTTWMRRWSSSLPRTGRMFLTLRSSGPSAPP
jgi:hypothetical protein